MIDIDQLDKSLQIAELVRASEAGFARDFRNGTAFGYEGDSQRLDAFMIGFLDSFARRMGSRDDWVALLAYLHQLLQHGPGPGTRRARHRMHVLANNSRFIKYVAGGRHHALRVLTGNIPEVGRFAELLEEELVSP